MSTFIDLKAEFDSKKAAYMTGAKIDYQDLRALGQRVVDAHNEEAKRIAKKFKCKPRLLSLSSLMH